MQSIFGGATSYEEQSLNDIKDDIICWTKYTKEIQSEISNSLEISKNNRFWNKVDYDFQMTVYASISYFKTILEDFKIIVTAIENNCISSSEITLLRKIGQKSIQYNREYPKTYKDNQKWHDYGNPKFAVVENMYAHGRDYFVTLQDAANAASRLEDYMNRRNIINTTMTVNGNVSNSQLQQGSTNSSQSLKFSNEFDYTKAFKILTQIQQYTTNDLFSNEFGSNSDELRGIINEAIENAQDKSNSKKLKDNLSRIKSFASNITTGIIANGIFQLIQSGFPKL